MAGKNSSMTFIYIFVGALVGLLFAPTIQDLGASAVANSTGIAATIYGYIGVFYALCLIGLMIGSLAQMLRR